MTKPSESELLSWVKDFAGLAVVGALKDLHDATVRQEPPTTWDRDNDRVSPDHVAIKCLRAKMRNLDMAMAAWEQTFAPPSPSAGQSQVTSLIGRFSDDLDKKVSS